VGDDQGGGIAPERRQYHLAGVDGVHRHRALPQHFGVDNRVGGIQVDCDKGLALQATQQVDQVVGHLL